MPLAKEFTASVYALKREEGGAFTPVFDGYSATVLFTSGASARGTMRMEDGMLSPGGKADVEIWLDTPLDAKGGDEFSLVEEAGTRIRGAVLRIVG